MTPEQAAAVQKIREALAAGPTDGPWTVLDGNRVGVTLASEHAGCGYSSHCVALTHGAPRLDPEVNAAYIAACDPATIRTILAALDAAQATREVPRLTDGQLLTVIRAVSKGNTIRLTRDVGPYEVTELTLDATDLMRAIESRVRELCGVAP